MVACLPLDDLSGYSSAPVAPFAGGNGTGGSASGGSSSGGSSSGAAATAGASSGQSGEGSGGALSLDPSGMAGGAGGSASGVVGSADAGSCDGPDEFAGADARGCYRLTADTATWLDARAVCIGWGGDLARIESAAEDDFLTARLSIDVWIGVNDREVEGSMVWADGSPLGYENWGDAQPDDFNAQEDCGEKRVADAGGWNDSPCDGMPREFLCER
jgi:lectin-like protein